jgi:hypothetical protein
MTWIIAIWAASAVIVAWLYLIAVDGYEDERGFHYGEKEE